jgi:hypothetical protein
LGFVVLFVEVPSAPSPLCTRFALVVVVVAELKVSLAQQLLRD